MLLKSTGESGSSDNGGWCRYWRMLPGNIGRGMVVVMVLAVLAMLACYSMLNEGMMRGFVGVTGFNYSHNILFVRQPALDRPQNNSTLRLSRDENPTNETSIITTTTTAPNTTTTTTTTTATATPTTTTTTPLSKKATPAGAPPKQAKMVLLLSYQRTGSSFLGDVLLNLNQDVFFIYEPLDALYAAMFGLEQGWTIPSDITTNVDGSLRVPPKVELEAVSNFLESLLICDLGTMPLEVYLHRLWSVFASKMTATKDFTNCMKLKRLFETPLKNCQHLIRTICGNRFAERGRRQDLCFNNLWKHDNSGSSQPRASSFASYDKCIGKLNSQVQQCIPHLQQPCDAHSIHAIKTVRATMHSVGPLLEKYPDLYVIHSYRDPLATVLSRTKADWSRSAYEKDRKNVGKIAHAYCQTVLEDFRQRQKLEENYPGRLMGLVYNDFVKSPRKTLEKVYGFLELPIQPEFEKKFTGKTGGDTSSKIAAKWKTELTPRDISSIKTECREFMDETGFKWDDS